MQGFGWHIESRNHTWASLWKRRGGSEGIGDRNDMAPAVTCRVYRRRKKQDGDELRDLLEHLVRSDKHLT